MKEPKPRRRRVLRALAWTVGALVALPVVLWLAWVAINWRDVAPSADALAMQAVIDARPVVDDADNAYLDMLGFDAPLDADAHAVGLQRRQLIRERAASPAVHEVFGFSDRAAEPALSPAWMVRAKACGRPGTGCDTALRMQLDLAPLDDANLRMLERYRALIAHQRWSEETQLDAQMSMPAFHRVLNAQRLSLISLWVQAEQRDATSTIDALDADLRFWRGLLASTDLLMTRMIATAAVRRNVEWSALILPRVHAAHATDAMPASLVTPITRDERSLRRTLAGEWQFSQRMVLRLLQENGAHPRDPDTSMTTRIDDWLGKPLFQPQDTANRRATNFERIASLSEASYPEIHARVRESRATPEAATPWRDFLYNPTGRMLDHIAEPAYSAYAIRVPEVEGVRRAVVASIELKRRGTAPEAMPQALAASEWRNPYDDTPFEWDAKHSCVVFNGLEQFDRTRTCVPY